MCTRDLRHHVLHSCWRRQDDIATRDEFIDQLCFVVSCIPAQPCDPMTASKGACARMFKGVDPLYIGESVREGIAMRDGLHHAVEDLDGLAAVPSQAHQMLLTMTSAAEEIR